MKLTRHFTATVYILKPGHALLIYHSKLRKWLPPGGHIEENETPPECAKREAKEETGIEIEFIKQENLWLEFWNASSMERPYLCLLENIPPHNGIPAHQHMDFIYLGRPIGGEELPELIQNKQLAWFSQDEVLRLKKDEDIFEETQRTLDHIFANVKL
jgi:8-oxo-dGTP pyrophosphatase MutT (NUDIX family)